ncbi:hypothetical protein J1605_000310 [Eschrichtius robustus]|uniref:Uncharacterized protein n=1 Tax=Eschrichtius robustus TaxID=9764 RepID=A0AB34HQC6_ESCRO|nr:hypothetical protein J1605_000310 [Eschrichtius robustus]
MKSFKIKTNIFFFVLPFLLKATYDVFSSPTTSDEPEISEPHTATSDPFLDSVPSKTSRTLEQPRATLAPSETPFVPQNLEIFTSPEMQPTTPERTTSLGTITSKISKSPEPTRTTLGNNMSLVNMLLHFTTESPVCQLLSPSKTLFISLKPKIPLSPEGTHTKPAMELETPPPSQLPIVLEPGTLGTKPSTTTLAPPKTKRPGRHPRPKATPSPDVPKSKPGKCDVQGSN